MKTVSARMSQVKCFVLHDYFLFYMAYINTVCSLTDKKVQNDDPNLLSRTTPTARISSPTSSAITDMIARAEAEILKITYTYDNDYFYLSRLNK